jgi:putative flippase GtrA
VFVSLPSFASFARYACVGVLNTLAHWVVFLALVYEAGTPQGIANLVAFLVAVSISYVVNAAWTFNAPRSRKGYLCYLGFMGLLALGIGWLGQWLAAPPLATACVFSAVSLVVGYAYARRVAFKTGATPC